MQFAELCQAMPERIETERLLLRPFAHGDADVYAQLANNEKISTFTPFPYPYGGKDAEHFIANVARSATEFAYGVTRDDQLLGGVSLLRSDDYGPGTIALGYWLGEPYWGMGFATEAASALTRTVNNINPGLALMSRAQEINARSLNVLAKLGFTETQRRDVSKNADDPVIMIYVEKRGERQ